MGGGGYTPGSFVSIMHGHLMTRCYEKSSSNFCLSLLSWIGMEVGAAKYVLDTLKLTEHPFIYVVKTIRKYQIKVHVQVHRTGCLPVYYNFPWVTNKIQRLDVILSNRCSCTRSVGMA